MWFRAMTTRSDKREGEWLSRQNPHIQDYQEDRRVDAMWKAAWDLRRLSGGIFAKPKKGVVPIVELTLLNDANVVVMRKGWSFKGRRWVVEFQEGNHATL